MIWFKSSDFHQVHDFSIHHFDQVHHSLFQIIVFEICHTDEKFSCMSADACEIDTQVMIVWLILIKSSILFDSSSSDFHQVHDSQVWFSSNSSVKFSDAAFWNFAYRRKNFFVCQSVHTKTTQQLDRRYYRKQCFDRIKSDQACLHRLRYSEKDNHAAFCTKRLQSDHRDYRWDQSSSDAKNEI